MVKMKSIILAFMVFEILVPLGGACGILWQAVVVASIYISVRSVHPFRQKLFMKKS